MRRRHRRRNRQSMCRNRGGRVSSRHRRAVRHTEIFVVLTTFKRINRQRPLTRRRNRNRTHRHARHVNRRVISIRLAMNTQMRTPRATRLQTFSRRQCNRSTGRRHPPAPTRPPNRRRAGQRRRRRIRCRLRCTTRSTILSI